MSRGSFSTHFLGHAPLLEVVVPWRTTDLVKIRDEFVQHALSGRYPITALCNAYGISEKTDLWKLSFGPLVLGTFHPPSNVFIDEVHWTQDVPPLKEGIETALEALTVEQGSPILPF